MLNVIICVIGKVILSNYKENPKTSHDEFEHLDSVEEENNTDAYAWFNIEDLENKH